MVRLPLLKPECALLLVALVALLAACSALPGQRRARTADEVARDAVEHALEQATEDAEHQPHYVFTVRYNPPACACPAFDVRIGNRWMRAELREGDARAPQLPVNLSTGGTMQMRLRPTSQTATDANGWMYPVLEVLEVLDDASAMNR